MRFSMARDGLTASRLTQKSEDIHRKTRRTFQPGELRKRIGVHRQRSVGVAVMDDRAAPVRRRRAKRHEERPEMLVARMGDRGVGRLGAPLEQRGGIAYSDLVSGPALERGA